MIEHCRQEQAEPRKNPEDPKQIVAKKELTALRISEIGPLLRGHVVRVAAILTNIHSWTKPQLLCGRKASGLTA
jgi:hypothetical protein